MKKCPFCAEEIQDEAKVCRFCHIDLVSGKSIQKSSLTQPKIKEVEARSRVMDGVRIGVGIFIVLPLIIAGIIILIMIFFGGIGSLATKKVEQPSKNTLLADKSLKTAKYRVYYNTVRNKINNYALINWRRSKLNKTGEVALSFTLFNSGALKDITFDESKTKGSNELIVMAMKSVKDCSPFSPFPDELKDYPELKFDVALSFEVE